MLIGSKSFDQQLIIFASDPLREAGNHVLLLGPRHPTTDDFVNSRAIRRTI
jgi:hypothetical protein